MTKRVLVLVEGQTEERFIKDVLAPPFLDRGLVLSPTILVTKRAKDGSTFKGGLSGFGKFRNDTRRLLGEAGGALVTTVLDYYRLPRDFPGMGDRPSGSPIERVRHIERAIAQAFGGPRYFIPFLALHEYEAWLFSSTDELPRVLTQHERQPEFARIRGEFSGPEDINERPDHSPSKRIIRLFPTYRKTVHGVAAAKRIGLDAIRRECPHFNEWILQLENFAEAI